MTKPTWTVSPSPFLRIRPTVSVMSLVLISTLIPHLILLALDGNVAALLNVLLAAVGALLAELCRGQKGRDSLLDGTVAVSGLLIGLLLPETYNPVLVPMVSFLGVLLARVIFGGTGSYWVNPAAVAVAIAWISRPDSFPLPLVTPDGIHTVGEAFGALKLDNFAAAPFDQSITETLNRFLSLTTKIRIPEGYVTLFVSSPSVIPAFRFNLLVLCASIVLISLDAIDWIVPASFLATYAVGLRFFTLGVPWDGGMAFGDILFGFLTSGVLFTAFYLLPEYATSPRTPWGKIVTGITAGISVSFLCGPGGSPIGAVFSVLVANALSPLIEFAEKRIPITVGGRA